MSLIGRINITHMTKMRNKACACLQVERFRGLQQNQQIFFQLAALASTPPPFICGSKRQVIKQDITHSRRLYNLKSHWPHDSLCMKFGRHISEIYSNNFSNFFVRGKRSQTAIKWQSTSSLEAGNEATSLNWDAHCFPPTRFFLYAGFCPSKSDIARTMYNTSF